MPELTLHQLDTKNGVVNPFKITKYDEENCKIEVEAQTSFPLQSEVLHGGFCLTAKDFSKLKSKIQTDCRNNQNKN